jgi:hypothetical protein
MRVTVRGRRYRLAFENLRKKNCLGYCDSPTEVGKEILIDKNLSGKLRLDTIIHELLHALYWDLSEESIEEAATDVAAVLWRLGYRGPTDGAG